MKMRYVLGSAALLLAGQANAAVVTWSYSGTITVADAAYTDLYTVGDTFSGYFSYETTTPASFIVSPPEASSGELAQYQDAAISGYISIGDFSLSYGNLRNEIYVSDNFTDNNAPVGDFLLSSAGFDEVNGAATSYLSVGFGDITDSVFASSALPGDTVNSDLFDKMSILISHTTGGCDLNNVCDIAVSIPVEGVINSVSVSTVPVPAAIWLFGSGLLGLASVCRRRVK